MTYKYKKTLNKKKVMWINDLLLQIVNHPKAQSLKSISIHLVHKSVAWQFSLDSSRLIHMSDDHLQIGLLVSDWVSPPFTLLFNRLSLECSHGKSRETWQQTWQMTWT